MTIEKERYYRNLNELRKTDFPERGNHNLQPLLKFIFMIIVGLSVLIPVNATEIHWDALLLNSKSYFGAEKYKEALASGGKALTAAEKLYGPDHLKTADAMFNLAEIYRMLGNFNNSESYYYGTLKIREKLLGREHPQVAACYYGLAEIMTERGEYQLAKDYAERALSIYEKTNGPDNVEIGNGMLVLAGINKGQLQYEAAESFGTKALDILEKTAGPDSLSTGKALLLLASLHIAEENYAEASALLQRADMLYIKTYKKKRLDTGKLLYYQGEILRLQGDPKKAQGLYKKALKYFEKRSMFHPDLGRTLVALAACRKSGLKYIKAEELHIEGLSVLEGSLGVDSILLEEPIREMAELLNFNRNHQQAGLYAYRLSKIREQRYGAKDRRTVDALNQLTRTNLKANRLSEAEFFCKQAHAITTANGDSGNGEKIASLLLRAKILIRQGDYPNAQSHWEEVSALIEKLSGENALLTVELLETESLLNSARGNYIAAESVLQKAITEAEAAYGEFHPELAELLKQLAALYEKQGRVKEAEAVEKRIKKIYAKIS